MKSKQLLNFISNENLYSEVKKVIDSIRNKTNSNDVEKNSIDPFSAVFKAVYSGLDYNGWMDDEKKRQIQKTMENSIGNFHQNIIGCIDGCINLGIGQIVDVQIPDKKIIAEIKNKHNTVKGSDKIGIYNDLKFKLKELKDSEYIAYYVEIIPKGNKQYNNEFTPSDKKTKVNGKLNRSIRVIDGRSFYALVTGEEDALDSLYNILPFVICDILGKKFEKKDYKNFFNLFKMTYKK